MINELQKMNVLLYHMEDTDVTINAIVKDDTLWITQKAMAELFDCSTDNVSLHLKNIYSCNELTKNATTEEFSVVQKEGARLVRRTTKFYNLDAIISVSASSRKWRTEKSPSCSSTGMKQR